MLRRMIGLMIGGLALMLGTGVAAAQDAYPPETPAAVTPCPGLGIAASGPLLPGATVDLTFTSGGFVDGATYSGSIDGDVALPPSEAAGGTVVFSNVVLPPTWQTDADHTASIIDVASGQVCGTVSFYVDVRGAIVERPAEEPRAVPVATAPPATGPLPATGSDSAGIVKAGAVLVAAGAGALLVARRRRTAVAA
jgi:LPXTG-motif cell wall-anchored protein